MALDARLSIRPNTEDLEALTTIATHLRVTGREAFATRSDAMRFALRATVETITNTNEETTHV